MNSAIVKPIKKAEDFILNRLWISTSKKSVSTNEKIKFSKYKIFFCIQFPPISCIKKDITLNLKNVKKFKMIFIFPSVPTDTIIEFLHAKQRILISLEKNSKSALCVYRNPNGFRVYIQRHFWGNPNPRVAPSVPGFENGNCNFENHLRNDFYSYIKENFTKLLFQFLHFFLFHLHTPPRFVMSSWCVCLKKWMTSFSHIATHEYFLTSSRLSKSHHNSEVLHFSFILPSFISFGTVINCTVPKPLNWHHRSNVILVTSPRLAEWFKTLKICDLRTFGFLARAEIC